MNNIIEKYFKNDESKQNVKHCLELVDYIKNHFSELSCAEISILLKHTSPSLRFHQVQYAVPETAVHILLDSIDGPTILGALRSGTKRSLTYCVVRFLSLYLVYTRIGIVHNDLVIAHARLIICLRDYGTPSTSAKANYEDYSRYVEVLLQACHHISSDGSNISHAIAESIAVANAMLERAILISNTNKSLREIYTNIILNGGLNNE